MEETVSTEMVVRFLRATPQQRMAFDRFLRATPEQQAAFEVVLESIVGSGARRNGGECGRSGAAEQRVPMAATGEILVRGRLSYRPGFEDVWLGSTHYDLRERTKARLCLRYLVEVKAFDANSARHLVEEIDPYVRREGDFPRLADIKMDDYFNDRAGKLQWLRRELVASAGRNGRYFLRVN